ncbi:MAG: hypothetical protein R3F53_14430 [Gammaproteobacteria bacterium]
MGTVHFMGLGKSIGVVTCVVDYIEKALDLIEQGKANVETRRLFQGSGGIKHDEEAKGKIESIVLLAVGMSFRIEP